MANRARRQVSAHPGNNRPGEETGSQMTIPSCAGRFHSPILPPSFPSHQGRFALNRGHPAQDNETTPTPRPFKALAAISRAGLGHRMIGCNGLPPVHLRLHALPRHHAGVEQAVGLVDRVEALGLIGDNECSANLTARPAPEPDTLARVGNAQLDDRLALRIFA